MPSNLHAGLLLSLVLVWIHLGVGTGGCEFQGGRLAVSPALLPLHMKVDGGGLRLRGGGKPDARSGIKALRSKESREGRRHLLAKKKRDAAQKKMKKKGASFKQTVLERLAEVAKREELLAQYKAKYGGEGEDQTGSSGGNNMGGSDASKNAGAKQAMRATRVDVDARKAVEILSPESSGKEEEEGVKGAGGTSPAMPASSSKPGSARSANSSSTRTMAPKSKAAPTKAPGGWPWNATTVEGILNELNRTGMCPSTSIDKRVRSFIVKLNKLGRSQVVLAAVREFRDHLSRPGVSHGRSIRNPSAVLNSMLVAWQKEQPKPFNSTAGSPEARKERGTKLDTNIKGSLSVSKEEKVKWGAVLSHSVHVAGGGDELAISVANSSYMESYPTVIGRRVFTNSSPPVEVVLKAEKLQRGIEFIGVVTRSHGMGLGDASCWWGSKDMAGKVWYSVSNGRYLSGPTLFSEDGPTWTQGEEVSIILELSQGRVTISAGGKDAVFEGIHDAIRIAAQLKDAGDSIRVLRTVPYVRRQPLVPSIQDKGETGQEELDVYGLTTMGDGNESAAPKEEPEDPRYTPPFMGRKVFVGGTKDMDSEDVGEYFMRFGEVATVGMSREKDKGDKENVKKAPKSKKGDGDDEEEEMKDSDDEDGEKQGKLRGFGFVTFFDVRDANRALRKGVVHVKKEGTFARVQILECEAALKKDLELDKATAEVLKKRDEERARAKQQLKLEKMTPEQLAEAEARAASTKAIGLDCEMVGVGPEGSRDCLAKVAICNEKGQPLYIRHVIPAEQVVDYRGHITGLRAEHLTAKEGAVTFEQAQARVSQMIAGKILVGHGLKHDLSALMVSHPQRLIRDTSKYKPLRDPSEGGTPSLKKLASRILGKTIHTGLHDPLQDAWTAMQVYKTHQESWERSCAVADRSAMSRMKRTRGVDKRKLKARQAKAKTSFAGGGKRRGPQA